jgi:hypothetical protein
MVPHTTHESETVEGRNTAYLMQRKLAFLKQNKKTSKNKRI